ncbi:NAD(P)-binding protein [Mycena kentingensis (nom. inval.)]|nr:NAD(P)-binding protein [Mycena kentingensis (nom. inval.)]
MVVVFAGARNPAVTSLVEFAATYPNVHPIKFTLANESENAAVITEIEKTVGRLDVVINIANAGAVLRFLYGWSSSLKHPYAGVYAGTPPVA